MLAIVRCILLLIYFIVINLLLIVYFIFRPMHRDNVHIAGKVYSSMSKILGINLVYRESNKIDSQQSYVCIGNHQNSYDIVTISRSAIPGAVTVGKKSLKWIPIFGLIYWLSGNIMIDRNNKGKARDTLSETGAKMREKNLSIFMFPEGTRSRGRGLLPFKTGAFRLATSQQKSIVPIVCSNINDDKIKLNRWNNGTVIIEVMDPVEVEEKANVKELAKHFYTLMLSTYNRISDEADVLSKH